MSSLRGAVVPLNAQNSTYGASTGSPKMTVTVTCVVTQNCACVKPILLRAWWCAERVERGKINFPALALVRGNMTASILAPCSVCWQESQIPCLDCTGPSECTEILSGLC